MTRFLNSGRFGYATGYKSQAAAQDAFDSMCNSDEMSPCEGRIESYSVRKDGKNLTRFAVTTSP